MEGNLATSSAHSVGSLEVAFTKALRTFTFTLRGRVRLRGLEKRKVPFRLRNKDIVMSFVFKTLI